MWRAALLFEFFFTETIFVRGKRGDCWGSTSRGGQKKAHLFSGGTGCFSQRVGSPRASVGASKESGSAGYCLYCNGIRAGIEQEECFLLA